MKKLTQEYVVQKCSEVHNNFYNYSKLVYVNTRTKVIIICPEHGEFLQIAGEHMGGQGCTSCSNNKKPTTEEYKEKVNKVHNKFYDYSKLEYINSYTKLEIICPLHGSFFQNPTDHLSGHGCFSCGKIIAAENRTFTTEQYIQKANLKHNYRYDYSNLIYINDKTKVEIICSIHGSFLQNSNNHLRGAACPKCSIIRRIENTTHTTEEYKEKANKVHNNFYDYSKLEYVHYTNKVEIICPIHGSFLQKPNGHLSGQGCDKCGGSANSTTEEFTEKVNIIHDYFYDYSKVEYINSKKKVKIICPIHGEFLQTPNNHLRGAGCPKCKSKTSFPEQAIYFYIKQLFPNVINGDRSFGKELDMYIPELNLGIEYDGVRWHKDSYDKDNNKNIFFKDKGIDLIRIREKGLYEIEDCYNILLTKNDSFPELETAIHMILSYINDKYNINYSLYINTEKDYITILEAIKNVKIKNSILNTHPEVAVQWHPTKNGTLTPEMFTFGSQRKVWWLYNDGREKFISISTKIKSRTN